MQIKYKSMVQALALCFHDRLQAVLHARSFVIEASRAQVHHTVCHSKIGNIQEYPHLQELGWYRGHTGGRVPFKYDCGCLQ